MTDEHHRTDSAEHSLPDAVTTLIWCQLWYGLAPATHHAFNAIIEDTTGWADLRDTVVRETSGKLEDIALTLDSVLDDLSQDDLDWITADVRNGVGATNPATFLATRVQDARKTGGTTQFNEE